MADYEFIITARIVFYKLDYHHFIIIQIYAHLSRKWQGAYGKVNNALNKILLVISPHHTMTVLRPFFRDHLGELVTEKNF